jgi:hypothetical protein
MVQGVRLRSGVAELGSSGLLTDIPEGYPGIGVSVDVSMKQHCWRIRQCR